MLLTKEETIILQDTTLNISPKDSVPMNNNNSSGLKTTSPKTDTLQLYSENDTLLKTSNSDSLRNDSITSVKIEPTEHLKEGVNRAEKSTDLWVFVILFFGFSIFAWVRIIFNKYLNHLIQAFFNFTTTTRLFRERVYKIMHAAFQLDLLFALMLSLSLFLINKEYNIVDFKTANFASYGLIFLFLILYYILRNSIYRLIGFIFNHNQEVKEYLFDNSIVFRNAGLVLLPLNTVISFSNFTSDTILLIYSFSITLIPLILTFRGFIVMLRKHISIFYLILYLCTLEILPLLLISKIIENYGNG